MSFIFVSFVCLIVAREMLLNVLIEVLWSCFCKLGSCMFALQILVGTHSCESTHLLVRPVFPNSVPGGKPTGKHFECLPYMTSPFQALEQRCAVSVTVLQSSAPTLINYTWTSVFRVSKYRQVSFYQELSHFRGYICRPKRIRDL